MNTSSLHKHESLVQTWSDKVFKGTVVNRECHSTNGGSDESTIPLNKLNY